MIAADCHVHTIMSGHAFSTLKECVDHAQKIGLKMLAITDHGPSMEHSAHDGYFEMGNRIPKRFGTLAVLFGCEMNILSSSGELDLPSSVIPRLDFVCAGLHGRTPYTGSSESANTTAIISAMKHHPEIDMITHPYRAAFPVSIGDVVQASEETDTLLEINLSVVKQAMNNYGSSNKTVIEKTGEMISLLQSHGRGYLVNTDAHIHTEIGIHHSTIAELSKLLGIKSVYILNDNMEWIGNIVARKKTAVEHY